MNFASHRCPINLTRFRNKVLFVWLMFFSLTALAEPLIQIQGIPDDLKRELTVRFQQVFSSRPSYADLDEMVRFLTLSGRLDDVSYEIMAGAKGSRFVLLKGEPRKEIRRIEFEGQEHFSISELESFFGIHRGEIFDADAVENQRSALEGHLTQAGFSNAHVSIEIERAGPEQVHIIAHVKEGRSTLIKEVRVMSVNAILAD